MGMAELLRWMGYKISACILPLIIYNYKNGTKVPFSDCFAWVKAPLDGFDIGIMKVLKH